MVEFGCIGERCVAEVGMESSKSKKGVGAWVRSGGWVAGNGYVGNWVGVSAWLGSWLVVVWVVCVATWLATWSCVRV